LTTWATINFSRTVLHAVTYMYYTLTCSTQCLVWGHEMHLPLSLSCKNIYETDNMHTAMCKYIKPSINSSYCKVPWLQSYLPCRIKWIYMTDKFFWQIMRSSAYNMQIGRHQQYCNYQKVRPRFHDGNILKKKKSVIKLTMHIHTNSISVLRIQRLHWTKRWWLINNFCRILMMVC
jgi:hypothetical protein